MAPPRSINHGSIRSYFRLAAVFAGLCSVAAAADQEAGVATELIAEVRESIPDGAGGSKTRFAPASILAQGEIVYYTLRISNPTAAPLRDVSVVQRVPVNTTYVPGSAAGPGALVGISCDGGRTFNPERTVYRTGKGGDAPVGSCTHIRWKFRYPLAPGATALARFQAVFN